MRDDMLTVFAFMSLLVACGLTQNVLEVTGEDTTFLHQSVHIVRYNPCGCIINAPQLDFEVRTNQTWRRIYLNVPEGEENTFEALRQYVLREPRKRLKSTALSRENTIDGAPNTMPQNSMLRLGRIQQNHPPKQLSGSDRKPENDVSDSSQVKSVLD